MQTSHCYRQEPIMRQTFVQQLRSATRALPLSRVALVSAVLVTALSGTVMAEEFLKGL